MPRTALVAGITKVLKGLHYPLDGMQLRVRWLRPIRQSKLKEEDERCARSNRYFGAVRARRLCRDSRMLGIFYRILDRIYPRASYLERVVKHAPTRVVRCTLASDAQLVVRDAKFF
jgi:hypothetical protein